MAHIIDEADAAETIKSWKQNGALIVLHTGCYEVLHSGHLACFKAGKEYGLKGKQTCLVVGVESDSTLCLNRTDKTRPLFKQPERCEAVANTASVDLVIRFDPNVALDYSDTLAYTLRLKKLAPDVMVVSYNDSLTFFNEIMHMQTLQCAEAGVLMLPIRHHIRTHATDAVDLLNRKTSSLAPEANVLWKAK